MFSSFSGMSTTWSFLAIRAIIARLGAHFDWRAASGHNWGMDTWTRIERGGFYPKAVQRALRRALGTAEPLATLCQVDTGFDRGSVFRHLTVASLTDRAIVQLHVDEMDGGSATIATAVHRVGDIAGYSTMEVYTDPENASGLSEMTIALDLKGARRLELEPARCDDPNCMADHGLTGTSFPDDMTFRISAAADGQDALDEAMVFVDHLAALMGTRSE